MLGTSVHETASGCWCWAYICAIIWKRAGLDIAVLTKLVRNSFMAIIIPFLAYRFNCTHIRTAMTLRAAFPIFILGFIFMSISEPLGIGLWLLAARHYGCFHPLLGIHLFP